MGQCTSQPEGLTSPQQLIVQPAQSNHESPVAASKSELSRQQTDRSVSPLTKQNSLGSKAGLNITQSVQETISAQPAEQPEVVQTIDNKNDSQLLTNQPTVDQSSTNPLSIPDRNRMNTASTVLVDSNTNIHPPVRYYTGSQMQFESSIDEDDLSDDFGVDEAVVDVVDIEGLDFDDVTTPVVESHVNIASNSFEQLSHPHSIKYRGAPSTTNNSHNVSAPATGGHLTPVSDVNLADSSGLESFPISKQIDEDLMREQDRTEMNILISPAVEPADYSPRRSLSSVATSQPSHKSSPFLIVPTLETIPYLQPMTPPSATHISTQSSIPVPNSPSASPKHHATHHRKTARPPSPVQSRTMPRRGQQHGYRHHSGSISGSPSPSHTPPLARAQSYESKEFIPDYQLPSPSPMVRVQTIETSQALTSYNEAGQKQINEYVIEGGELGSGSSGSVKLCYSLKDQRYHAMKVINKTKLKKKKLAQKSTIDAWEAIKKEIAIMKKLHHPHVVQLFEVIDDDQKEKLYLIMEFMENGAVLNTNGAEIWAIPEFQTRAYIRDALCGLKYLHSLNVIHRDIKPDNLLLNEFGQCKIGDLGSSTLLSHPDELLSEYHAGSPLYRPPEMCHGLKYDGRAADVWSLGVSLYQMLYGRPPFGGSSMLLLNHSICEKDLTFPSQPEVDSRALELMTGMLQKDPRKRLTVSECLQNAWITEDGNWLPCHADDLASVDGEGEPLAIIVTPADMAGAVVEVSRIWLLVSLKSKMARKRRTLKRTLSLSDQTIIASLTSASGHSPSVSSSPQSPHRHARQLDR